MKPSRMLSAWVLAGVVSVACVAFPARADEYIDRVNATFKQIPKDKRSDLVILPVVAKLEAPPAGLRTQERAALIGSKAPNFQGAADWAQKEPQKAVIAALDKVAKEEDRLKSYAFAQPYGVEGVEVDLISAGMYTELGNPPLLAAARPLYMPALENAGILAHVEASRLAESGDTVGAIKVITDWLFFARQMADRPLMSEKKWAMESMKLALERIRDLAYQDFRAEKHTMEPPKVRAAIERLRPVRGFLALDRIALPEGDFLGREQLTLQVLDNSGPIDSVFASTMARVASSDRPLRLFAAEAFWRTAATGHANLRDTRSTLDGLRSDWRRRWDLSPFDPLVATVTEYRRRVQTTSRFAILNGAFDDVDGLFSLRQQLATEAAGTRMSLGVYGYFLRQKLLPKTMAAARPEYIDAVDKDPYSRSNGDIQFFVPGRDTPRGPNGEEQPRTVTLYPPEPYPSFKINIGSDQYIIYSVGPDDDRGFAAFATQTRTGIRGDYLLFPPTLSLYRQRLLETNQLR